MSLAVGTVVGNMLPTTSFVWAIMLTLVILWLVFWVSENVEGMKGVVVLSWLIIGAALGWYFPQIQMVASPHTLFPLLGILIVLMCTPNRER